MTLAPGFFWLDEQIAIDLPGARALFTTRRGGVSEGPFASLNLGLTAAGAPIDEPARVEANRAHVLGITGRAGVALGRQVHGADVARVEGNPQIHNEIPQPIATQQPAAQQRNRAPRGRVCVRSDPALARADGTRATAWIPRRRAAETCLSLPKPARDSVSVLLLLRQARPVLDRDRAPAALGLAPGDGSPHS